MTVMNKNHLKSHRLTACLTLVFVVCTIFLSGCSLAKKDASVSAAADRFCGVFVTIGDMPADESPVEWKNGALSQPETKIEGTYDKNKALNSTDNPLSFGNLSGYGIVAMQEKFPGEDHWTNSVYADEEFSENHFSVAVNDQGEDHSISSVLYSPLNVDVIMQLNPIYQRSDGSFYLILRETDRISSSPQQEGESMSCSISETNTLRSGKEVAESQKISVTVAVQSVKPTVSASLLEYSQDNRLLQKTALPLSDQTITLSSATAFIVVEETSDDGSIHKRSVYNWSDAKESDDQLRHTLYPASNGTILHPTVLTFVK